MRTMRIKWGARLLACVALATSCAVLLACGTSGEDGGSGATDPALVRAAKKAVREAKAPISEWIGPTRGPRSVSGKRISIISCAQASACSFVVKGAQEAATALGWDAQVIDGKGDPSVWNGAIRNAVNSKVEGIVNVAIPPDLVADAVRFAHDRGVPIVNASEVFRRTPGIAANANPSFQEEGDVVGQWLIADSDGEANVVMFRDDEFPGIKARADRIVAQLERCDGCELLDEINLQIQDVTSPRMGQVTKSALSRFGSKLKYIVTPFDAADAFVVPQLKASGRTDVKVIGGAGGEQQMGFCREGSVAAVTVDAVTWMGWAAVDQLNRVFRNEEPDAKNEKAPFFLATPETCPEEGRGEVLIEADYKDHFKRLWGVE